MRRRRDGRRMSGRVDNTMAASAGCLAAGIDGRNVTSCGRRIRCAVVIISDTAMWKLPRATVGRLRLHRRLIEKTLLTVRNAYASRLG